MSTGLGDIAVYLARRGWHVYPQAPLGNSPTANCANGCGGLRSGQRTERTCPGNHTCPCSSSPTRPCHALYAARNDAELTWARWKHAPRCNPALHLGWSNLLVVEIDCHDTTTPAELAPGLPNPGVVNGLGSFAALLDHLGQPWPTDTLIVESPTGGQHLYYQAPRLALRHCYAAWQVEVKAGACSITAPGSVRKLADGTTGTYERISDAVDPAPFPRWLGEWLVSIGRVTDPAARHRPAPTRITTSNNTHPSRYWESAWSGVLDRVATKDDGRRARFETIYAGARRLANLAAHDGAPWSEADAVQAVVDTAVAARAATGRPERRSEATEQAKRGWRRGCADGPESLRGRGGNEVAA
ncbi:bifunctional DNA primase/polymerase [Saccharopolyspora sp. NPDC000995]